MRGRKVDLRLTPKKYVFINYLPLPHGNPCRGMIINRTSHSLGKCSTTELYCQAVNRYSFFFFPQTDFSLATTYCLLYIKIGLWIKEANSWPHRIYMLITEMKMPCQDLGEKEFVTRDRWPVCRIVRRSESKGSDRSEVREQTRGRQGHIWHHTATMGTKRWGQLEGLDQWNSAGQCGECTRRAGAILKYFFFFLSF